MTEVLMGYLFSQTNSKTWLKGNKDTVSKNQIKQQNKLDLPNLINIFDPWLF